MLGIDLMRLERSRLRATRRWVKNIEIAWQAWEDKLRLGESGLRQITEFFQPRPGAGQEPDMG